MAIITLQLLHVATAPACYKKQIYIKINNIQQYICMLMCKNRLNDWKKKSQGK